MPTANGKKMPSAVGQSDSSGQKINAQVPCTVFNKMQGIFIFA
jgi:hypothetical protein